MPVDGMGIFDRGGLRRQRGRAAAGLDGHDFLFREVAERLADRLDDIKRKFPLALDLGCHTGQLARALGGRGGTQETAGTANPHEIVADCEGRTILGRRVPELVARNCRWT